MISQDNILLVTADDGIADTVKSALGTNENIVLADVCAEVSQLGVRLSHTNAPVVIVDIDPDPAKILSDVGAIIVSHPELKVVVLSSSLNPELILEAMHIGAKRFLQKKSVLPELTDILQKFLSDKIKKETVLGSVICVFSASGGCGATTVAINLANELRIISSNPVLAVDLDCHYGTMSAYLGITGKYGLVDVLEHKDPLDENLIKSSAYNYMKDFHILLSPASLGYSSSQPLQYDNLPNVLEVCRKVYGYTIVDAPRIPESVAVNLAALSSFVIVVFQPMVKDVKTAHSIVSSLLQYGIAREKIIPLANRFRKWGPLVRLEDTKEALGLDSLLHIRSDWRKVINCVNHGRPIAQVAPVSGLRHDFQKLASKIYGRQISNNGKLLNWHKWYKKWIENKGNSSEQ